jgi:hypothetical protein
MMNVLCDAHKRNTRLFDIQDSLVFDTFAKNKALLDSAVLADYDFVLDPFLNNLRMFPKDRIVLFPSRLKPYKFSYSKPLQP